MKYECKENDAVIELGRDKDEVLVYIQGETAKTVIGLKDLHQALNIFGVSVSLPSDPMVLAEYLHNNYEQIAKRTNWQTQRSCKVEFKDLPLENKNTMILLAGKLILDFVGNER